MFENDSFFTSALVKAIQPISPEEENIIRRYVSKDHFNIEKMIYYLNNHDEIGREAFEYSFTPSFGEAVRWTFLAHMVPVDRSTFIKRLPIYVYDLTHVGEDTFMSSLFDSYKVAYTDEADYDENYFGQPDSYPEDFDLEPLYKILESIIYTFKIPLEKVFTYIVGQFGSLGNYEIFEDWVKYINLVDDLNEFNVFPHNILFALNVELEKHGLDPVMCYPAEDKYGNPIAIKTGNVYCVGGYFPVDEEGTPVNKWIAVWTENIKNPSEKQIAEARKNLKLANKYNSPALRQTLRINLNPDTSIFIGRKDQIQNGAFADDIIYKHYWKQAYVGPKRMKLDYSAFEKERTRLHLSIKDVADATGINIRTYQRIESGESSPDGLNLLKLVDFFNLDPDDLVHKEIIEDDDFSKFRSGKTPSEFINNEDDLEA